ncbi:MAG: hypothetical protein VX100_07335 [Pseudomonadota bacterium]|nr:hypothetical protein [Pseudomonadota bacterium]
MFKAISLFVLMCAIWTVSALELQHINNVSQDYKRNIYFSTHDGVFRFDGNHYLKMADVSNLPDTWVNFLTLSQNKKNLFIAYNSGEIWSINLENNNAFKVADFWANKVVASEQYLYAQGKDQILAINLTTNKTTNVLHHDDTVYDIAANTKHGYTMTKRGVFLISATKTRLLSNQSAEDGEIVATPHGALFSNTHGLNSYVYIDNSLVINTEITNIKNLTYANPHYLYFTSNGFINQLAISNLKIVRRDINQIAKPYRSLFVDSDSNLWAININDYEFISSNISVRKYLEPSVYNVISPINDALMLGTQTGIYTFEGNAQTQLGGVKTIDFKGATFAKQFGKNVVLGNSEGAYYWDPSNNKTIKIFDGYVNNATIIRGHLFLATDTSGVVVFDDKFNMLESQFNYVLPSKNILSIKEFRGALYIATDKGLWIRDSNSNDTVALEGYSAVSDVALVNDVIYASTYGGGLFQHAGGQWEHVASPQYIVELISHDNKLYMSTKNGIHYLATQGYSKLLSGTSSHSFTPGSLHFEADRIIAASHLGIVSISFKKPRAIQQDVISYLKTDQVTHLNPSRIEIGRSSWIDIALTDYDFSERSKARYQYRLGDQQWHSIPTPLIQLNGLAAGNYRVMYRKSYDGKVWTSPGALSFNVAGPWYSSSIAISSYIVVLGLLALVACSSMGIKLSSSI